MFRDVEFMTAREKELVLRNFKTFLRHGLKKEHFHNRLYKYLHLNCGFIAHYNIHRFYCEYFETGHDIERFFEHFCGYCGQICERNADYGDLNTAMCQVYDQFKDAITSKAEDDIDKRLELLETSVRLARNDRIFARQLLGKVRI